ncbi:hypothetical protein U0070_002316, partial [Myodes glareolus]
MDEEQSKPEEPTGHVPQEKQPDDLSTETKKAK